MNCQNCGHKNRPDRKFCSKCGTPLNLCFNCGSHNQPGEHICGDCGSPLNEPHLRGKTPHPRLKAPPYLTKKILSKRSVLEGERRRVTVLFSDASGFTSISEKLNEEQVYYLMQDFLDLMVNAVYRYEGTVTQFLGDGIMALFGAPIAQEDSGRRAVSAALTMQDSINKYSLEVKERYEIECRFRVGLNTGPVVVGRISDDLDMEYTALGETVNLAARMQQVAEPGSIYISENTYRLVKDQFDFEPLGTLRLKGKKDPVAVYKPIGERPQPTHLNVSDDQGLTPFVGRDKELGVLRGHLDQALAGQGQVVLISGEAGIGKSRLLMEFHRLIHDEDIGWFEGRCISLAKNIPYWPVIDLLKHFFGVEEEDSEDTIIKRIDERTNGWTPSFQTTIPFLKYLFNVDPGNPKIIKMDARERRAGIFNGLRALILHESDRKPLVLVVEDLHWIDEQSELALSALLELVASRRVLLIFNYRPGYEHSLGERTYFHRLSLIHFKPEERKAMVERTLQVSNLPEKLLKLIIGKAEGNPFFIEEVTKSLLESEVIHKTNDTYSINQDIEEAQIPDTIQEVILSRIDRLAKKAKEALQLASVIGREFTARLLNRLSDFEGKLEEALDELKLLELIYQKDFFPELSYMFKHALTHDVAYFTILERRRKELHRIIGVAIEELYTDRLFDQYELLAHHFLEGENWIKALDYLIKAGQKAASGFANQDALDYYSRAILACEKLGKKGLATSAQVFHLRGMLKFTIDDFPGAIEDFNSMYQKALQIADRHLEGVALAYRAWVEWWNHDFETAEKSARLALKVADEGFEDVRFFASSTIGLMYYGINQVEDAKPFLREARKLAPKVDDALTRSWWSIVGWHQSQWEGRFEDTLEHLSRWRMSLERTGSIFLILGDRWLESVTRASKGDYNRALALLDEVLTTSDRVGGVVFWYARALNTIGWIYGELQDFQQAMSWNSRGVKVAQVANFPDPEVESNARLNLGDNLMALGRLNEAEEQFQTVEQVVLRPRPQDRLDLWRYAQHMFHSYGELWLARKDYDQAFIYADKCLSLAEPTDARKNIVKSRRLRGQVFLIQGKLGEANQEFSKALEIALKIGNPPQLWKTYSAIGNLLKKQGRGKDAIKAYQDAIDIIEGVASELKNEQLKNTFLKSTHVKNIQKLIRM